MSQWSSLSDDVLVQIFQFASASTIHALLCCNKHFYKLVHQSFLCRAQAKANWQNRLAKVQTQVKKWRKNFLQQLDKMEQRRLMVIREMKDIDARDALFYLDFLTV